MRKMLIIFVTTFTPSTLFAGSLNTIAVQGKLDQTTPITGVGVSIWSGDQQVGTGSSVDFIPDANGVFSTTTYISDPKIFLSGTDYEVRFTNPVDQNVLATIILRAVPIALAVRGDQQTGDQNVLGAYGNVGIGTDVPQYRLVISSGAGEIGNMMAVSIGGSDVIRMTGAGDIFAQKYYGDGSNLSNILNLSMLTTGYSMSGPLSISVNSNSVPSLFVNASTQTIPNSGFSGTHWAIYTSVASEGGTWPRHGYGIYSDCYGTGNCSAGSFIAKGAGTNYAINAYADGGTKNYAAYLNGKVQIMGDVNISAGGISLSAIGNIVTGGNIISNGILNNYFNGIIISSGVGNNYFAGNVGIGVTSVTEKLEVSGNINAQGRIKDKTGYLVPVGTIITYVSTTPPQGWLQCNGQSVFRDVYADLFTVIGCTFGCPDGITFKLPDLRGEFIRGYDDGRGVDTNRGFGTSQGDAIRNITGGAVGNIQHPYSTLNEGGALYISASVPGRGYTGSNGGILQIKFDASRVVPTASENRPRNIALVYIIKY